MLKNRKKQRLDRIHGEYVAGVYLRKPNNSRSEQADGRKVVADHHEFMRQQARASRTQRRRRLKARRAEIGKRRKQAEADAQGR